MTRAPILVALDTPTAARAVELATAVAPHVAGFKVGLELLMGPGSGLIGQLRGLDRPVFADAKLHDIPNTVQAAARQLGAAGARWVTVHASGGREMMEAATAGLRAGAGSEPSGILAVTVLTSLSDLGGIGIGSTVGEHVDRMAALAAAAGVEGAVCSAHEIEVCKRAAPDLVTVVPGIRPANADRHDQARVATPTEAIDAGADYLVIGRAISGAADPAEAARTIARSILER